MASVQTKDYIVQLIKEEILSGVMKPGRRAGAGSTCRASWCFKNADP